MKRRTYRNRKLRQMATAGATQAEIARHFGISRPRVCQILRRDGLVGKVGRPRLPAMSAVDYADYVKLRACLGAAYARQAMGIGA